MQCSRCPTVMQGPPGVYVPNSCVSAGQSNCLVSPAGLDAALLGAAPDSDDSEDDESSSGGTDFAGEGGVGTGFGDSDSDDEMETLLVRDERRMQGGVDAASASSSSTSSDEAFSAPRRRFAKECRDWRVRKPVSAT